MTDALHKLEQLRVVGVLRASGMDEALEQAGAALQGGLKAIELTFTTPDALEVLARLKEGYSSVLLGMGTILYVEQLEAAVAAGADFLVSPHLDGDLVETAQKLGVPYVPGVMTPSEVLRARKVGCDLLKVFPTARTGGASYLKDLLGPFPDLKIMATGGVKIEDVPAYLDAGARVVGLGSIFAATAMETESLTRSLVRGATQ